MSHNGNTELLLCLFEEEIETVQKRFPKLTNAQTEHVAAKKSRENVSGTEHNEVQFSLRNWTW